MLHKEAENALKKRYAEIQEEKGNNPDWAYKNPKDGKVLHPSIPFIGRDYFHQPVKMLVYASAENLSNYDGRIDESDFALNRHRAYFEKTKTDTTAFPSVHIEPINNGSLTICAYYLLSQLSKVDATTPSSFLETIAVANYGKYTWYRNDGKKNNDYAGDRYKLAESQPFVRADIEILKPDYIVMIKQMYSGAGRQGAFVREVKGDDKIIPIYQMMHFNFRSDRIGKSPATALKDLPPTLQRWMLDNNQSFISRDDFKCVFEYLTDRLKNKKP